MKNTTTTKTIAALATGLVLAAALMVAFQGYLWVSFLIELLDDHSLATAALSLSKKIPYEYPREGTRVRVYWNLHRDCFSFQSTESGRVIAHYDVCTLSDAKLVVRKAGNEKVRREGKKNVHAFAVGRIADRDSFEAGVLKPIRSKRAVTYNPYKYTTFVDKWTKKPVRESRLIIMASTDNGHAKVPVMTAID